MAGHSTTSPVADLGTVGYNDSLSLQRRLVEMVKNGEMGDVLLFLDHPPVFTVGRGKRPENYAGIEVTETERGGDVTYHGPGQLVVYPIIDLNRNGIDGARKFVHLIEHVIIASIGKLGYEGKVGDEPGIWVGGRKVASIGLAIRDRVSFHGLAINIGKEVLDGFNKINPCGLTPETIGYIEVERDELREALRASFEGSIHPFEEVEPEFFDRL